MHSPEVFPRTDGTTYVCAISSESPLPVDPGDVAPDPGAIERLQAMCSRLSPALGEAKVLAAQACYRPVTQDGLPLIGRGSPASRAPTSPPATASGASSTRRPPARRWPS